MIKKMGFQGFWKLKVLCLGNKRMSLKAYQVPKHCMPVYNIKRKNCYKEDCTTLMNYSGGNHFIFCYKDCKISSRNILFKLRPRMCAACLIGKRGSLPGKVELRSGKSWSTLNFFLLDDPWILILSEPPALLASNFRGDSLLLSSVKIQVNYFPMYQEDCLTSLGCWPLATSQFIMSNFMK